MEAVILIGIQGAGKTTFYRERFFETHVRISLDLLKTRNRERMFLQTCLATQQRFVVDNTNPRKADRAVYIESARRAGFRVTGYFFNIELKDALRRNAQRTAGGKIPAAGVIATWKKLERPSPSEGFVELYAVSLNESGGFAVRPWMDVEEEAHV